ncbi:hypothetical protein [Candidatus Hodgkinia cicadicola]
MLIVGNDYEGWMLLSESGMVVVADEWMGCDKLYKVGNINVGNRLINE